MRASLAPQWPASHIADLNVRQGTYSPIGAPSYAWQLDAPSRMAVLRNHHVKEQTQKLLELALFSVTDYAFVLMDPDGTVVDWLGGAQDILGYSAQEVMGRPISIIFMQEDLDKGLHLHELEVASRDSKSEDDRWHVRKDGTRIWVSGTVTALRDANGICGFIKIMRDRTDLRINSENRSNQLEAVEGALDRTRRFLHTLGHELRNPLAPIRNLAFLVERISPDPRIKTATSTIDNQVAVLERIAADLMDVARLHQRKLDLRLSNFDVRELLEQEAAGHMGAARAKGVRLETLLPQEPIEVVADPQRLRQAISNLLVNAVKYTTEGGSIWVKATLEAEDLVIRVQDTGIGIAPDVLPRIFDLFTQEPRASELVPGGLGVGLSIVNQIAELHGGVAQARSSGAGKGSEFALRLPRHGPSQSTAEETGPASVGA